MMDPDERQVHQRMLETGNHDPGDSRLQSEIRRIQRLRMQPGLSPAEMSRLDTEYKQLLDEEDYRILSQIKCPTRSQP
jgi:hypothetical protein